MPGKGFKIDEAMVVDLEAFQSPAHEITDKFQISDSPKAVFNILIMDPKTKLLFSEL